MSKQRGLQAKLEAVWRLRREQSTSPQAITVLRSALKDPSAFLVAEAAQIVAAQNLNDLGEDLAEAFKRFMTDPAESDKGCRALIAITEALNQIDYQKPEVFLGGLRHVQKVWDGNRATDQAAPLRAHAAMGLARVEYPGVINLLVELLLDEEPAARVGAARGLAGTGKNATIPLLRYKVLAGDPESSVIGSCFASLIALEPDESIPFVARYLSAAGEVQQEAALALGESRRPAAFEHLSLAWKRVVGGDAQETLLLAIALLRLPSATEFLVQIVIAGDRVAASGAIRALAIHRHNPEVRKRVLEAVASKEKPLRELFERKFSVSE